MTDPKALLWALCSGLAVYVGLAAAPHATIVSAIPYGASAAVILGLIGCAAVALKKEQPNRK